ncbi:MAG: FMN-binding protein [Candidatus Omnitrophota bacterium]
MTRGDSLIKKETPFTYYQICKDKEAVGYIYNTLDILPEKQGYAGPIEILVEIDIKGEIKNLKILKHSETPQYASRLTKPGFLDQFKGKDALDGFIVGEDIDAITHATISSQSVADILRESLNKFNSALGLEVNKSIGHDNKTLAILQKIEKAGLEPKKAKYYEKLK